MISIHVKGNVKTCSYIISMASLVYLTTLSKAECIHTITNKIDKINFIVKFILNSSKIY